MVLKPLSPLDRTKSVTREEFDAFVSGYGKPLVRDVFAAREPPLVTFNDLSLGAWPDCTVAYHDAFTNYDNPEPTGWRVLR